MLLVACGGDTAITPPPGGNPVVAVVVVSPAERTLTVGETVTVGATPKDADGTPLAGRAVTWSLEGDGSATISPNGVVTVTAPGVVRVVATSEGKRGVATLTVRPAQPVPVARVDLDVEAVSLVEGSSRTLVATPKDAAGNVLADRAVAWSTSDALLATVDASGKVSALRPGTVLITARSEGKERIATFTVTPTAVASVVLTADTPLLEAGSTLLLSPRVLDAQGRELYGRSVSWTWNDAAVASVTPEGLVIARAPGTVRVAATVEGKSAAVDLTVDAPPSADLLYQRSASGVNELFTLSLAAPGATPVRINAGTVSRRPSASPDGARIAFAVSMTDLAGIEIEDIFTVDRNGMNMQRVTTAPGVDDWPAWSPVRGANLIAYTHVDQTSGRSDIWVMNADGSAPRNLTAELPQSDVRREPAWSPDGQWIAFSSSRSTAGPGRGSIWIMRADGSQKRQLTLHPDNGFDQHPTWSPDGQRIAFTRGGIAIVTVATGAVTVKDLPGLELDPVWSPDGRHIAYGWRPSEPGSGTFEIHTIRADGTDRRLRVKDAQGNASAGAPQWIARH